MRDFFRRRVTKVVLALVILAGAAIPGPQLRILCATAFSELANALYFDTRSYPDQVHVRLHVPASLPAEARVSQDARLELYQRGRFRAALGISVRREVYWPSVLAIALVIAMGRSQKSSTLVWTMFAAVVAAMLWTIFMLDILVQWMLCHEYRWSSCPRDSLYSSVINGVFYTILTPPVNRYLLPLVVALSGTWWSARRDSSGRQRNE